MPRIQLTDVTIRALKSDVRVDYWDTKMPGFSIRVGKNTKTFIAKVNNQRTTIGLPHGTTAWVAPTPVAY